MRQRCGPHSPPSGITASSRSYRGASGPRLDHASKYLASNQRLNA
jgi:hypothetical protein